MPNNEPIDAAKVQWDSQPQIDPNKVQWDNEEKPKSTTTVSSTPTTEGEKSTEGGGLLDSIKGFGTPTGETSLGKKDVYADVAANAPLTLPNAEQKDLIAKKYDPNVFVTPESFPKDSQAGQFLNKVYQAVDNVPQTPFSPSTGGELGKLATKAFIGSAISTLHNSEQLGQVAEDMKSIDQDPAAITELPAKLGGIAFGAAGLTPPLLAFNTAIAGAEEGAKKLDQTLPELHASDYFQAITSPFQNQLSNHVFAIPSLVGGAPTIIPVKDITRGKQGLAELMDLGYYAALAKGFHGTAEAIKENKVLTPEQRNEVAQAVGEVKETEQNFSPETLKKIPPDLPNEQKIEVAPLIEKKHELEASKENLDDSFHAGIDAQKAELTKQINTITNPLSEDLTDLQKQEAELTKQLDTASEKVRDKMDELKSKGTSFNESEGLKTLKQKEKDHSSHLKQVQDAIEKKSGDNTSTLQVENPTESLLRNEGISRESELSGVEQRNQPKDVTQEGKPKEEVKEKPSEELPTEGILDTPPDVAETKVMENFTDAKTINRDYAALKKKIGEKKAQKYFNQVDRLIDPNKNTVVEYRENGVVTKEGDKYIFNALSNLESKDWHIGFKRDISDQFEKSIPKEEVVSKKVESEPSPQAKESVEPIGEGEGKKIADFGSLSKEQKRSFVDEHFNDIVSHLKSKGMLRVDC